MAVAYKGEGNGVTTEASSGDLNPTCPATVDAGDVLIAHVAYEGVATTPSTPADWTLLTTDGYVMGANLYKHWIFGKIAIGDEDSDAISFGTPAVTTMRTGRIYSFSGRTSGTISQIVPSGSFAHQYHATDPAFPTVTTTTVGALAVACIFQADDNGLVSATGESGGDWTEAVAEYAQSATTPDSQLGLQTCTPTANPGTVTGGTISTANDPVGVIGFQIMPNSVTNVTVNAGVQTLTGSQPAATVTVTANKTVSPSVQSSTFSQPAPTITALKSVTVSPAVQGATFSQQSIQITVGDGVSAGIQSATFSQVSPTITTTKNPTVSPTVQSATFSTASPTVTATADKTVSPNVQSGTLSQISPQVLTGADVTTSPSAQSATFSQPTANITATESVSVSPDVQTLTFTSFSPDVSMGGDKTISVGVQSLIGTQPSPTVDTVRYVTVSPGVISLVSSQPTPSISSGGVSRLVINTKGKVFYKISESLILAL